MASIEQEWCFRFKSSLYTFFVKTLSQYSIHLMCGFGKRVPGWQVEASIWSLAVLLLPFCWGLWPPNSVLHYVQLLADHGNLQGSPPSLVWKPISTRKTHPLQYFRKGNMLATCRHSALPVDLRVVLVCGTEVCPEQKPFGPLWPQWMPPPTKCWTVPLWLLPRRNQSARHLNEWKCLHLQN